MLFVSGGHVIEQECRDYIEANGYLQPGHVFVSAAGRLPCKKVIHAVGPRQWQGGNNNEEQTLRDAVYESMLSAEQCGLSSIALPALGGGASGYPLDKCTNTIVTTVKNFLEDHKQTCVKRVSLVVPAGHVVAAFQASLRAGNSHRTSGKPLYAFIGQVTTYIIMLCYFFFNCLTSTAYSEIFQNTQRLLKQLKKKQKNISIAICGNLSNKCIYCFKT